MTSTPLSEGPQFRGKTLTPESPVPLHVPEPTKIPVLQNQIDPVFNLMSTHMEQTPMPDRLGSPDSQHKSSGVTLRFPGLTEIEAEIAHAGNAQENQNPSVDEDVECNMDLEIEAMQEHITHQSNDTLREISSSSIIQPSTTVTVNESPSIFTQVDHSPSFSGQSLDKSNEPVHDNPKPHEPNQGTSVTSGHEMTAVEPPEESNTYLQTLDTDVNDGGVNYQALLDNLSPSAHNVENIASVTTPTPSEKPNPPRPSSAESPIASLPLPVGLPPRPPPQEKPTIHPNYSPGEDIRSYHYPHTQSSTPHTPYSSQPSNPYRPSQGYPHPPSSASVGANGLPPPPLATFQQPPAKAGQSQPSPLTQQTRQVDGPGRNGEKPAVPADEENEEIPWPPEVEKKYAEFLHDEAVYVAEGLWDRFPQGSRLFIGNLFTEKVSKRDLFSVFHKYGRLAQVSIKNAYGFIQYLDAGCSLRALQAEQGQSIKGRKLHLEISKPQKNSRNAAATAAGDNLRAGYSRRSRSPDYGRGQPQRGFGRGPSIDRFDRPRDEPRRRDDYRPVRSPSPRSFRGRDEYRGARERSPDRYYNDRRSRSRSPYNRVGRYRSRSPRNRDMDDEAELPLLRRDTRDVPDVQMILVDEVNRTFVIYIEKSFRDRDLRCELMKLPRASLTAVIKRQILEGVQAVVTIFRQSEVTGKISLQVFDRRGGIDNVRFDEYDELDAHIAAELVVKAKSTHIAPAAGPGPGPGPGSGPYSAAPIYGVAPYGQPPQHVPTQQLQPNGAAPNLANLITSMDGPALQKLLGAMAQNPQTPHNPQPQTPQQAVQIPDLAALLSNVTRQQQHHQQHQQHHHQQQQQQQQQQQGFSYDGHQQQQLQTNQYPASAVNPSFTNNSALSSLLSAAGNRPQQGMLNQQQQMPSQQQHHVQNVMDQLARWKQ